MEMGIQAFDCLEEVAVLNKRKQSLKELAEYLLQRENWAGGTLANKEFQRDIETSVVS